VHAAVLLVDPESGLPSALLEGTWLTALRTGAASGLATDLLARPDASVLGVIGAGVQARTQVEAVRAVRRIEEVRVASRTRASAESLARELEAGEATAAGPPRVVVVDSSRDAASGADVVVTATDSATPVLPADAVAPGAHVNAVGGYRPDMQELPSGLVARARLVVDQVAAALAEAGDVVIPIAEGLVRETDLVELGAVAAGRAAGRRLPDEITVFKSVGSAAQDLALAALALERARAAGAGTVVEL
jgi:ornithine cyclodeaminase